MAIQSVTELAWRKAQRSVGNGACVEVAPIGTGCAVRDSKDPDGPILTWTAQAWQEFVGRAKSGWFDTL